MIRFTKMEGIGNDYVYINGFEEHTEDPAALAVKMSRYHFGCYADGLIMILPSQVADFRMQMFNNDGSESEMCGNGIRCVAAYCHDRGLTDKTEFTIESGGQIKVSLVRQGRDAIFTVSDNGPGISREELLALLAENNIDVEYMYSLFFHEKGKACMVLRITNEPMFLSVLGTNRVRIVGMDELGLK